MDEPLFTEDPATMDLGAKVTAAWTDFQAALADTLAKMPDTVGGLDITLDPSAAGHGAPLSWDNVLYDSPALGYVNATHQSLLTHEGPTVLTYYWALSSAPEKNARQRLFDTPHPQWAESILQDLSRPHPDIRNKVEQLDIFRWGHAMSMPVPGWIWSAARERLALPHGRVHFAHSDLSGFSIFEEANYWGVKAADGALKRQ